jgi:Mn-dependent DtxR family transcriptional regulator
LCSIACGYIKQREIARDLRKSYSDISHCLSRLIDLGLVSKNGVFYTISDTMLSFWLKHVYVRRQQMLVNYIVDKTRVYRDDIHAYVSDFLQESKKSILERVYELFHLFSNDLVEIGDRKLLLPQCDKVEIKTFDDITPYVVASSKKAQWICQIFHTTLGDLQISEFVKNLKSLEQKVARKIVIPVCGMEENTKLLAKELRILTWDLETVNILLRLYDRKGIVVL